MIRPCTPNLHLPNGAKERIGNGYVLGVMFSPSHDIIAVATSIGVELRESQTQDLNAFIPVYGSQIGALDFSSDGILLAFGCRDGAIEIWRVDSCQQLATFTHDGPVGSLAFSKDRKLIAASGGLSVKVWEVETEAEVCVLQRKANAVAFSPTRDLLAIGGEERIWLWDVASGRVERELGEIGGDSTIVSLAFSQDGRFLAAGRGQKCKFGTFVNSFSGAAAVTLWDTGTWRMLKTMLPHGAGKLSKISGVAFTPDARILAAAVGDRIVLFDVMSGEEKRAVDGGTFNTLASLVYYFFGMQTVSFDRAGHLVASGCSDRTFKVWDVEAGREDVSDSTERRAITALGLGPADDLVALGYSDGTVRVVQPDKNNDLLALQGKHGAIMAIALSPDMEFLAILSLDRTVTLWHIESKTKTVLQGQRGSSIWFNVSERSTFSLEFTANSSVLVSSGSGNATTLWDVQERKQIGRISGSAQCTALTPKRDLLAIARGGVIELWNVSTRKRVRKLRKHRARISAGTFDRNGHYLVSGCEDGTINLWEVETGRQLWESPDQGEAVVSVGVSPDGRFWACGFRSGLVQLWSLDNRKKVWSKIGHAGTVMSVMFSSSDKFFVSHSREDGTALVWDVGKIVGV